LAEQLCRTADRIDPARVFGPHHCLGRGTSASDSEKLCGLLSRRENASVIEQGCACLSPGSAIRRHKFARHTGRTSSSIRSDLDSRYTHAIGNALIRIELAKEESEIASFEWIEDGKPYREWLIPASLLNDFGKLEIQEITKSAQGQ
jgi:hypothetical protein